MSRIRNGQTIRQLCEFAHDRIIPFRIPVSIVRSFFDDPRILGSPCGQGGSVKKKRRTNAWATKKNRLEIFVDVSGQGETTRITGGEGVRRVVVHGWTSSQAEKSNRYPRRTGILVGRKGRR